jgi:broad-specificity NMP kinase
VSFAEDEWSRSVREITPVTCSLIIVVSTDPPRLCDRSKSRKYDLERSSSQVISHTQTLVDNVSARITEANNNIEASLRSMRAHHEELVTEIAELKSLFIAQHLHAGNHVPGFADEL